MITTIFLILAIIATLSIYIKTKKIKTLSNHQGIKLTNQAFLFFAMAYISKLLTLMPSLTISKFSILNAISQPIQTYLFTIAALYLSASLFWKTSSQTGPIQHVLLDKDKTPLHIIALTTTIIANFTNILPLALITIYAYTATIAYTNYQTKKSKFSQAHLIAIYLLLISQIITLTNFSILTSQAMTITAFSIFLYGTLKIIK